MTKKSSAHPFTDWAKSRLDEMDATLAVFEARAADVQADTREKADAAIADMKKHRDVFKAEVEANRAHGATELAAANARLQAEGQSFEGAVDTYWNTVTAQTKDHAAVFKARVEAQQKAWQEAATRMKANAAEFGASRKVEFDSSVSKADHMAREAGEKLNAVNAAGKASWSALRSALAESRTALDAAYSKAVEAFKHAQK